MKFEIEILYQKQLLEKSLQLYIMPFKIKNMFLNDLMKLTYDNLVIKSI